MTAGRRSRWCSVVEALQQRYRPPPELSLRSQHAAYVSQTDRHLGGPKGNGLACAIRAAYTDAPSRYALYAIMRHDRRSHPPLASRKDRRRDSVMERMRIDVECRHAWWSALRRSVCACVESDATTVNSLRATRWRAHPPITSAGATRPDSQTSSFGTARLRRVRDDDAGCLFCHYGFRRDPLWERVRPHAYLTRIGRGRKRLHLTG